MKFTIDELQGLDIKAYLEWQIKDLKNAQHAFKELPRLNKKLVEIVLCQFRAFLTDNKATATAFDLEFTKIKNEINQLNKCLDTCVVFADPRNAKDVIKKYENENKQLDSEDVVNVDQETIADDDQKIIDDDDIERVPTVDIKKVEQYQDMYLGKDWKYKKTITYQIAETINFDYLLATASDHMDVLQSYFECNLERFERSKAYNQNATKAMINEALEFESTQYRCIMSGGYCLGFFTDIGVIDELASLAFYSYVANDNEQIAETEGLNKTEFVELVKALIEARALDFATQKEAVEAMAKAFKIDITIAQFNNILNKIKKRNTGEELKFLTKLHTALGKWINHIIPKQG